MLVIILHAQNFINLKIHQFVLKILNGNKILTSIEGHNSVEKITKKLFVIVLTPYLHFVNINAFTKFYQNPSIGSQDIEHKRNYGSNQGP